MAEYIETDLIHWGGVDLRPTSLHGNGAASFERTTREGRMVTCRLCQSLLGKCDGSSACEATVHIHGCYADRDGAACDDPDDHVTGPAATTSPAHSPARENTDTDGGGDRG